jgi:hypothetical protein
MLKLAESYKEAYCRKGPPPSDYYYDELEMTREKCLII